MADKNGKPTVFSLERRMDDIHTQLTQIGERQIAMSAILESIKLKDGENLSRREYETKHESLIAKLENVCEKQEGIHKELEKRLKALEEMKANYEGRLAVIGAVAALIVIVLNILIDVALKFYLH